MKNSQLASDMPIAANAPAAVGISDHHLRSTAKGGSLVFFGKLFNKGVRLGVAILMARFLAAEQFGIYSLGLTVTEIVAALGGLGLGTALVRYIPAMRRRSDQAGIWGTLQLGIGIPAVMSIILAIALFALADPIAQHILHDSRMASPLRLMSFFIPFYTWTDMVAAATRGFRNMKFTVVSQLVTQPLVKLSIIGVFVILGLNATRALTAAGISQVVTAALLLYFLSRQFPLNLPLREARREPKEMLRFSLPVYLSGILNTFGEQLQVLIVAGFTNVYGAGVYALAQHATRFGELFQRAVTMSAQPIFSELFSENKREELARLYQATTRWTFSLNLPLFLILILLPSSVLAVFGNSYAGGVVVLVILAWRCAIGTATGMCSSILDMTGYTALKLVNSVIRVAVSLGLGLWLIPKWGIVGGAAAALIADATDGLLRLVEIYILHRMLPFDRTFLKPIAAALASVAVVFLLAQWLPTHPPSLYAAIQMTMLFSVYFGMNLVLGLPPEELKMLAYVRQRASMVFARS